MSEVGVTQTLVIGHLWQSVALAAVLALVLILGKRMRGATRYGLGVAAFMASLALPLAAFIPGETIVAGLLKQLDAPIALQPVETTRMEVDATGSMAAPVAPVEGVTPVLFTGDADALHVAPVVAPAVPVAPVVTVSTETQPLALFTLPELKLPDLGLPVLAIWLGVAAFLLFRTGRDLLAVERLVARARPADLPQALQARMKGVRVVVSPEAPGPMAAGLLRPCIVLPESIALASPGMAGLLEHEHAHIRRRDMLAALGQRVALALLWWSPALYWISRRMDEEREVACDEAAVDRTGDAKAFARSLTKQAENQLWVRAPRLAVGAIGPRSHFGRRVRRLIDIAKTGGTQTRYSGRIACAGLVLAVGVAAMVTPRFTAEAQPPASDVQGAPGDSTDRTLTRTDRTVITLDGGNGDARSYSFSGADGEFAALGAEIEAMMAELQPELQGLMAELGPELESLMGELTPELQAEMAALGVEMSALGIDIAGMVSQDVISDMPQIMAEVRRSLEEAGIDPDSIEGWDDLQDIDVDMEEMRRAIAEAREELAQTLGPELKAEIRAALADARADLADARAEMADHHMEIANAMSEGHLGLEIARHALAAARDEIAAARANGELNFSGRDGAEDFGADLERTILDALRAAGVPVDGEGVPRPLAPPQPPAPLATPN
jgi:beta-lactamase regulating signal transducer with metallopeptidase domain